MFGNLLIYRTLTLFLVLSWVSILPSFAQKLAQGWQTGKATFYHKKFYGRRTANGERLRAHELTAAHRSLPFGTKVRVVHRKTGKSIIVRINDRGPHVRGCVIDLTKAGAKKLGIMQGQGNSLVIVQPLAEIGGRDRDREELTIETGVRDRDREELTIETEGRDRDRPSEISNTGIGLASEGVYRLNGAPANPKGYALQVAAYYCPESALYEAKSLSKAGYRDVFLQVRCTEKEETLYRVMVGQYRNRDGALAARPALAARGWEGIVARHSY